MSNSVYNLGDKIATRVAYGNALAEFGCDERIVVLDADLSKSTKTDSFKKAYPERFVNCGIAEGNMMSVAAGMSTCGNIVFASSFAIICPSVTCSRVSPTPNSLAMRIAVKISFA